MDVADALKNTSKGQLNYTKPWEEFTDSERQQFMADIRTPPKLPLDVAAHRIHPSPDHTHSTTPPTLSIPSPISSPPLTPPATPPYTTAGNPTSPLDSMRRIHQDLESEEDSILHEVEVNMKRWRSHFSGLSRRHESNISTATTATSSSKQSFRETVTQIQAQEEEDEERQLKKLIDEKLKSNEKSYQAHYQFLKEQIQQNEVRKQQQMQELLEARNQRRKAMVAQFEHYEQQGDVLVQTVTKILEACQHRDFLARDKTMKLINNLNILITRMMNQASSEKQAETPKDETLQSVATVFDQCQEILVQVKAEVETANKKGEEELKKQAELERQRKEKEEKEKKRQQPVTVNLKDTTKQNQTPKKDDTAGAKTDSAAKSIGLGVTVSPSALEAYTSNQEKIEAALKNTETLTKSSDQKLKKYRFELQKAINTPISGISSHSGDHLGSQIRRLRELLMGQSVPVADGTVSINSHAEAKTFCMNFLAKKLVKQGEDQVSSRPVTAFPIAGVIVHLSCDFKEFLNLFVAHCQASCPVLVPMYFEQNQQGNNSDSIEWHKLQGYKVSSDGAIEKEDLYLKRIEGIIKLYAAVIQTSVVNTVNKPHPHGLEHCWVWLARIMNMDPKPNITATAIHVMLEVCGAGMLRKYGKQFRKLIQLLQKEYLPKIEKVTPADYQGPYSRLKMFLEDCLSKGRIPEPDGALSDDFWQSQSKSSVVGF